MAGENAPPSLDPADADSMLGMARMVLQKFLQGVDDMLPAKVVSYDRATNRAEVVPMVRVITTDGRQLDRAKVASIPVFSYGGGGFTLNFPLKSGDMGWIKANDRDISLMLQAGGTSPPNTKRLHSFQDAMFFPDVMRGYTIGGGDADAVVLQALDGSSRVAVGAGAVRVLVGAMGLEVTGAGTTITGPVIIAGALTVSGTTVIGGVTFQSHKHTGVTTGGGQTGGPV